MAEGKAVSTGPLNDQNSVPLTFTVFPELPMELQLRIWKLTIPGPRVIKVKVFVANTIYDPGYIPTLGRDDHSPFLEDLPAFRDPTWMAIEMEKAIQGLVLTTDLQSPGLLFACKISREIALEAYPKCFELGRGRKIRFSPSQDTLLISHTCQKLFQPLPGMPGSPSTLPDYKDWFTEVTQLAMDAYTRFVSIRSRDSMLGWLLSQFPLLKTLILVASHPQHVLDLLETQKEVQLYTVEESVAASSAAGSSDTPYPSTLANPQLWVALETRLITDLEDFRGPAGWQCPEMKIMFLGTNSVIDPFPYMT